MPADSLEVQLAALYREHVRVVWRSLRRFGVPESGIEDAVQDVFLVAHRKLHAFEGSTGHRAWLVAIALRIAREHYRRDARLRLDDPAENVAPTAFPDDVVESRQRVRLLDGLLDTLSAEHREVFVMAEIEELSAPEIAEATGVTLNTVYSRLRLARQRFERALLRVKTRIGGALTR